MSAPLRRQAIEASSSIAAVVAGHPGRQPQRVMERRAHRAPGSAQSVPFRERQIRVVAPARRRMERK